MSLRIRRSICLHLEGRHGCGTHGSQHIYIYIYIIRGACKNDSHFFLTLSFLVSDANDFDSDTKEEGEEEDDAYYFAFDTNDFDFDTEEEGEEEDDANDFDSDTKEEGEEEDDAYYFAFDTKEEGEEEDDANDFDFDRKRGGGRR